MGLHLGAVRLKRHGREDKRVGRLTVEDTHEAIKAAIPLAPPDFRSSFCVHAVWKLRGWHVGVGRSTLLSVLRN